MEKINKKNIKDLKDFLLLLGSQSISQLGTAMTSFALILWAYQKNGTVMTISMLSIFTYLPYVLVSIFAGTFIDKWNKKTVMLISDAIAAICTVGVLILYQLSLLQVWHLYIINTLIGLMNAFQFPASNVAVTLIVPKKHYTRVSGLQSLSDSAIRIFPPIFAASMMSWKGMQGILIIDLISFFVAFNLLLLCIKIPNNSIMNDKTKKYKSFSECKKGFVYLLEEKGILYLILSMSIINLLGSMAFGSVLDAMILSRTDNNQIYLGFVRSAMGVGGIIGSIMVTLMKTPKSRVKIIFNSCALSFLLSDILLGVSKNIYVWVFGVLAGNIVIPFLNSSEISLLRTKIPVDIQGRVFSIRSAIQFGTIPLGALVGGVLADKVFEPLMLNSILMQETIGKIVGTEKGSGMAIVFIIVGILGVIFSIIFKYNHRINELDK